MQRSQTIGIPRALLYFRYGTMWETFFSKLGFDVVVSEPTDKLVYEQGDAASMDECCIASKIYMGHVRKLLGNVDMIFVPTFESCDVRAGFCTKHQSLPDLVRATFREEDPRIVSLHVPNISDKRKVRSAYISLARELGATPRQASSAYKAATRAQSMQLNRLADEQKETFKLISKLRKVSAKDSTGSVDVPLTVLLVAHPYISHDSYVSRDVVGALERLGACVIYADETNRSSAYAKSFEFSETLPWVQNRELVGSILMLKDKLDGIVLLSAFPCGPDSMFDEAVMRKVGDVPILNLMIDSQSGSAGIETRIESFIDILNFKKRGSYEQS